MKGSTNISFGVFQRYILPVGYVSRLLKFHLVLEYGFGAPDEALKFSVALFLINKSLNIPLLLWEYTIIRQNVD